MACSRGGTIYESGSMDTDKDENQQHDLLNFIYSGDPHAQAAAENFPSGLCLPA